MPPRPQVPHKFPPPKKPEAKAGGRAGRTRGVVPPGPSRPLCGGASWSRRPAARTAPAEPAVSRRVSNGTVPPHPALWCGGRGWPRRPGTPPPFPSQACLPPRPPPRRRRAPARRVSSRLPTPRHRGADIWRAASRVPSAPASRGRASSPLLLGPQP